MATMSGAPDKSGPAHPADAKISTDDARQYWEGIEADINGMLGGFPYVSKVDLRGSRAFLTKLGFGKTKPLRTVARAMEGGAGIGRITEGLLLDISECVDVVEPIAKFTAALEGKSGIGNIYNVGLEEWQPEDEDISYDLIWNQWCLGHLTDRQLVEYLTRCKDVLRRDENGKVTGFIVVKENLTTTGTDLFDETDSSVTRYDEKFRELFSLAGLKMMKTELQHGLPKELFPVRMYALKPKAT